MERSIDLIISILGILKVGASYLPAEPKFPKERINYMMKNGGVKRIITKKNLSNIFKSYENLEFFRYEKFKDYSDAQLEKVHNDKTLMYVLYTSGSTGEPKGVMIEHGNVINYIHAFQNEFKLSSSDRMLQLSVCSFDIFVEEVYPILSLGGCLVIADNSKLKNITELLKLMEKRKVTILSGFPYLLNDLKKYTLPKSIHTIISGGDVLRKDFIDKNKNINIYNTYGPSETTVCATYYKITGKEDATIPIGKAIKGVDVHILDEKLNKVPIGTVGEICISGKGVGRGYLNKPKLTEEVFVINPFDNSKTLYRSGDLGIMLKNGEIEFLKRKDEQIMIKGKRVEIKEIEKYLNDHPEIEYAFIKSFLDSENFHYICAYILSPKKISLKSIKSYLLNYVPNFMIPEFFIELKELSFTESGKIDTKSFFKIIK